MKLNLKNTDSDGAFLKVTPMNLVTTPDELKNKSIEPKNIKQLSIFFMYNGHDWEAHEILGVPQGVRIEFATKAYQELLKTADPSTFEFLEAAHNAILKKRRPERL